MDNIRQMVSFNLYKIYQNSLLLYYTTRWIHLGYISEI